MCVDKGEEKKKEAGRAAKGQIHTLLRCHHPLAFPFSLKKEHAYFPQTKRVEDPEKADICAPGRHLPLTFPFSLKEHLHPFRTSPQAKPVCIHGD